MKDRPKRRAKLESTLTLICLATGAITAGYFLYLHPLMAKELPADLVHFIGSDQRSAQIRNIISYRFTRGELTSLGIALTPDNQAFAASPIPPMPPLERNAEASPSTEVVPQKATNPSDNPQFPKPSLNLFVSDPSYPVPSSPVDQTQVPEGPIEVGSVQSARHEPALPAAKRETGGPEKKSTIDTDARRWVINAISTPDEEKMRQTLQALKKEPYHVYHYQVEIKGQEWYRVRVGFFDTREEAEKIGTRLAQEYGLSAPWIVKPGPQEIDKFNQ